MSMQWPCDMDGAWKISQQIQSIPSIGRRPPESDDLLFGKTLLHVQSPPVEGLDSKSQHYSKAGGRRSPVDPVNTRRSAPEGTLLLSMTHPHHNGHRNSSDRL